MFLAVVYLADTASTTQADVNSNYIVILLILIFIITFIDFIRRIFGLGGNRP